MNSVETTDTNTSRGEGQIHAPRVLACPVADSFQGTKSSNTVTQYPLLTFQVILPAFCALALIAYTSVFRARWQMIFQ